MIDFKQMSYKILPWMWLQHNNGWSPVQRSPTDCGVPEYDGEALKMRCPCPTRGLLCYAES